MTSIFHLSNNSDEGWNAALDAVSAGGAILFPTETVYGLGVDSASSEAMEQLYEWKGRPREKPFQWLVADVNVVRAGCPDWNNAMERVARAFWPGPMTLVLPAAQGTIGWRIPKHEGLLSMLKGLSRPLIATSANLSGKPASSDFQTAFRDFEGRVKVALDGGIISGGVPSTVVQIHEGRMKVLRGGVIPEEQIRKMFEG